MLERTDTEWGPWTIVEATDRRWARAKIFQTIIQRLEEALKDRGFELPVERPRPERKTERAPELPGEHEYPDDVFSEEEDADDEELEAELAAEAEAQAGEE
jgi:hypothetical protein